MAARFSLFLCLLSIWFTILASAASSHHAPAPSADCSNLVLTMADCLSFVTNGSTTTKPEGNCCSGLKTVLKADPACLCEAFKSSAQFGVVLNVTKALTLPAACKVSAPSATNCGLSVTPAAAPAAAGALSPGSSPTSVAAPGAPGTAASASSGPTSAPTPSAGNSAAASLIPFSAGSLLAGLLLAMFSSF